MTIKGPVLDLDRFLPEGFSMVVYVEEGNEWVDLIGPDGEEVYFYTDTDYALSTQMVDAVNSVRLPRGLGKVELRRGQVVELPD